MKKRLCRWIAALGMLLIMTGMAAQAAGRARIVEIAVTEDARLLTFVRDAGNVSEVTAMVGKNASEEVSFQTLSESGLTMKTLILVDNSLSIPTKSRTDTKKLLLEFIAARKENEMFAFGTISDEVQIVQDFTDDYIVLKTAIDAMEYQYQDTYITDALYDYLTANPLGSGEDAFERILLVSDGVDNKSIGYTKDELLDLLDNSPLPIYTVGVQNGTATSNQELENMFSISRHTGADYCLLSALENGVALASRNEIDWNNLVVFASIPEEAQDGSLKTATLTLKGSEGESQVSIDQVRMPLKEAKPAPAPTPAPTQTPVPAPEETQQATDDEESENTWLIILIAVLGTALVAGAALAVILLLRAKKKKSEFEKLSAEREKNLRDMEMMENGSTVHLNRERESTEVAEEGGTIQLWGRGDDGSTITLTDINTVDRRYQKPISRSLIIGLSRESDICINYDKSVSRTHCEILKEGGSYYIINHSQSNGTLLNGNRVVAKTPIVDGAIIKMGRVEMRVGIKN